MGYLITETNETGQLIKDYIWQEGMTPLAQIDDDGTTETIAYLYTDHVMTNRLATNPQQQIIWTWEGEAFGNTQAQELTATQINLRFPGQYYDQETNLHYNHFRYYDPSLGRYITSDPIGLQGGMNTFSYSFNNPIILGDVLGLAPKSFFDGASDGTHMMPGSPIPGSKGSLGADALGLVNDFLDYLCGTEGDSRLKEILLMIDTVAEQFEECGVLYWQIDYRITSSGCKKDFTLSGLSLKKEEAWHEIVFYAQKYPWHPRAERWTYRRGAIEVGK